MVDFILWVFESFLAVISSLTYQTINLIDVISESFFVGDNSLNEISFNLSLFSDTPILSTNVYDFLLLFFSILYTTVFVVIVWKIIKKVVVKITGWKRW